MVLPLPEESVKEESEDVSKEKDTSAESTCSTPKTTRASWAPSSNSSQRGSVDSDWHPRPPYEDEGANMPSDEDMPSPKEGSPKNRRRKLSPTARFDVAPMSPRTPTRTNPYHSFQMNNDSAKTHKIVAPMSWHGGRKKLPSLERLTSSPKLSSFGESERDKRTLPGPVDIPPAFQTDNDDGSISIAPARVNAQSKFAAMESSTDLNMSMSSFITELPPMPRRGRFDVDNGSSKATSTVVRGTRVYKIAQSRANDFLPSSETHRWKPKTNRAQVVAGLNSPIRGPMPTEDEAPASPFRLSNEHRKSENPNSGLENGTSDAEGESVELIGEETTTRGSDVSIPTFMTSMHSNEIDQGIKRESDLSIPTFMSEQDPKVGEVSPSRISIDSEEEIVERLKDDPPKEGTEGVYEDYRGQLQPAQRPDVGEYVDKAPKKKRWSSKNVHNCPVWPPIIKVRAYEKQQLSGLSLGSGLSDDDSYDSEMYSSAGEEDDSVDDKGGSFMRHTPAKRTSYRIRYDGPTSLQLPPVPQNDSRFEPTSLPPDGAPHLPSRIVDAAPMAPPRKRESSLAGVDDESSLEEGEDELKRPDVWITPMEGTTPTEAMWKVRRVWEVEPEDDKEHDHSVHNRELLDKIKTLVGAPASPETDGAPTLPSRSWHIQTVVEKKGRMQALQPEKALDDDKLQADIELMAEEAMQEIIDNRKAFEEVKRKRREERLKQSMDGSMKPPANGKAALPGKATGPGNASPGERKQAEPSEEAQLGGQDQVEDAQVRNDVQPDGITDTRSNEETATGTTQPEKESQGEAPVASDEALVEAAIVDDVDARSPQDIIATAPQSISEEGKSGKGTLETADVAPECDQSEILPSQDAAVVNVSRTKPEETITSDEDATSLPAKDEEDTPDDVPPTDPGQSSPDNHDADSALATDVGDKAATQTEKVPPGDPGVIPAAMKDDKPNVPIPKPEEFGLTTPTNSSTVEVVNAVSCPPPPAPPVAELDTEVPIRDVSDMEASPAVVERKKEKKLKRRKPKTDANGDAAKPRRFGDSASPRRLRTKKMATPRTPRKSVSEHEKKLPKMPTRSPRRSVSASGEPPKSPARSIAKSPAGSLAKSPASSIDLDEAVKPRKSVDSASPENTPRRMKKKKKKITKEKKTPKKNHFASKVNLDKDQKPSKKVFRVAATGTESSESDFELLDLDEYLFRSHPDVTPMMEAEDVVVTVEKLNDEGPSRMSLSAMVHDSSDSDLAKSSLEGSSDESAGPSPVAPVARGTPKGRKGVVGGDAVSPWWRKPTAGKETVRRQKRPQRPKSPPLAQFERKDSKKKLEH